jgi:hypothetical protein
MSKSKFIQAEDGSEETKIDDIYERSERTVEQDPAKIRRENLLNIYKEKEPTSQDIKDDEPDLSKGIKYKPDPESDSSLFSQETPTKRPMIQEIKDISLDQMP